MTSRLSDCGRVENILFIFVDGLGVGADDPAVNPCSASGVKWFRHFISGTYPKRISESGFALTLDATLGVRGLPQSGTGQTSLFTGVNAAALEGAHSGPFPNSRLRALIAEQSIFRKFTDRGLGSAFLNAYTPPYFEKSVESMINRLSVTSVAVYSAGLPFMNLDDLRANRAVFHDITNEILVEKGYEAPLRTPEEAGRILGRASQDNRLSVFEFFMTDRAGHSGDMRRAVMEMRKLEVFLSAVLDSVNLDSTLVLLSSDHGNIENMGFRGHTRNPAMTLVFGQCAALIADELKDITDISRIIAGNRFFT